MDIKIKSVPISYGDLEAGIPPEYVYRMHVGSDLFAKQSWFEEDVSVEDSIEFMDARQFRATYKHDPNLYSLLRDYFVAVVSAMKNALDVVRLENEARLSKEMEQYSNTWIHYHYGYID